MNQKLISPQVTPFFDADSHTISYIVQDPSSSACAVIDPVLEFNYSSGTLNSSGADAIIEHIQTHELELEWLIETHIHADHVSASSYIKERIGGRLLIGEAITVVQRVFGEVYNEDQNFKRDGSQFDLLLKDNDEYSIGNLKARAIHTPGHTPACMTHIIGDCVFVGDTLFMPDAGTARTDFPGGCAQQIYRSVKRILSLPQSTRLFMCHDYCPNGRALKFETTVEEQRQLNIHINETISESEFVTMREARDRALDVPKLILPSLQINIRAGCLPASSSNNTIYLKIPINAF